VNSDELPNLLRTMAEDHGPEYSTAYWQGWSDAIGSHVSTLTSAADEIERLRAEINSGNTEILRLRRLITEWADVADVANLSNDACSEWCRCRGPMCTATRALRRAVGR
jgi:hypothetical protein